MMKGIGRLGSSIIPVSSTIPHTLYNLIYVDSEELVGEVAPGSNALDGDPNTYWHTEWLPETNPPHPHEIQVDLNGAFKITGFSYLPRQDGSDKGFVKDYQFYLSGDSINWTLITQGILPYNTNKKEIQISPTVANYFRFVTLSDYGNSGYAATAEVSVRGIKAQ